MKIPILLAVVLGPMDIEITKVLGISETDGLLEHTSCQLLLPTLPGIYAC